MNDNMIIAVVAAASAVLGGAITGLLAPFVKHRPEQASVEKQRKRDQIAGWRQMLLEVDRAAAGNQSPGHILHLHAEYITLEPFLAENACEVARTENRTFVVGQALCLPLETLKNEIARIEKDWGLQR